MGGKGTGSGGYRLGPLDPYPALWRGMSSKAAGLYQPADEWKGGPGARGCRLSPLSPYLALLQGADSKAVGLYPDC